MTAFHWSRAWKTKGNLTYSRIESVVKKRHSNIVIFNTDGRSAPILIPFESSWNTHVIKALPCLCSARVTLETFHKIKRSPGAGGEIGHKGGLTIELGILSVRAAGVNHTTVWDWKVWWNILLPFVVATVVCHKVQRNLGVTGKYAVTALSIYTKDPNWRKTAP